MKRITYLIIFIITAFLTYLTISTYLSSVKNKNITFLNYMVENEAKTLFNNIVITREWSFSHGGVYVLQKDGLEPNPYLKDNTLLTKDDKTLIKINPAWMTRQISELSNKVNNHSFHITSLKPKNPNNKPNDFEVEAMTYFMVNPKEKTYSRFARNSFDYNFMGALKVKPTCLECHWDKGYSIGDIIGGISIKIPLENYKKEYYSILDDHKQIRNIVAIVLILIVLIGIWIINRYFINKKFVETHIKDLQKLKDENETLVKRYKYAMEASQIGIWDWDLTTGEVYFDKNWKEMLGYTDDELANDLNEWDIRVHPDDKQKAIQDIEDNHNKKTSTYINIHRLRHKNGDWVWIYDKGKTYFDKNENPIRMIGSHTNITHLKELELELQEKEKNLTYVQEIAQMGHWKYYSKEDKFIISNTLKKLIGLDIDNDTFSYDDFKNLVHDEDIDNFVQIHKKALNSNENTNLQYKLKKINSDEYMQINEYISNTSTSNSENKIYLGSIQNITHIKNLENDLILFSTIINNSPISILITDTKGQIIYINPYFTKVSGYKLEEVMGKKPNIIKSPSTDPKIYKDLWETITNKQTWGGIFKNLTKEKKEYWETALIIPIIGEKGEITNYLGIKREITKEIFLKKELEEKEELMLNQSKHAAMGEMISMIAHQWRQPITTISMAANNILADIELDMFTKEEGRRFVNEITRQTQFLSNTIEDFRNFFKQDKNLEKVSLKTLFEDTSSIILASLKNNGIELKLGFDENLTILTYRRELVQVLINLIKNAKEALQESTNESKIIEIKIDKNENDEIDIEIIDNAGGIKEEILDKIFDAYFTTKDEQNGTGLGLYMSKMIIEKHLKGKISVSNNQFGATFKVVLPKSI